MDYGLVAMLVVAVVIGCGLGIGLVVLVERAAGPKW